MPEAPEIEILKRELSGEIVGQYINNLYIGPPSLFSPSVPLFKEHLPGKIIKNVDRYGKLLVILLSNDYNISIHFGMGGSLLYVKKDERKGYDLFLELSSKQAILIRDLKYGKISLTKDREYMKDLGPDVLYDQGFSLEYFKNVVTGKNKAIKSILMDQKIVAGLGNTYTDEILYRARIHPKRKAKTLTGEEIERLFTTIKEIINRAIELGGNSEDGFQDIYGKTGKVQEKLIVVHHREGRLCPVCGSKIEKIRLGGRDTYFCPICQL